MCHRFVLLALVAVSANLRADDHLPAHAKKRLVVGEDGEGVLWSVTFSPDGKILAVGGSLKKIHLFNVESGELLRSFGTHLDNVWAVAFSNDGKLLCSGGRADLTLRAWNPENGEELTSFEGHRGGITRIKFFRDGKRLIMSGGSWDPTIRVWDVAKREHLMALTGHGDYIDSMDLASHGRIAVSGSRDGSLRLWSLTRGRMLWCLNDPGEDRGFAAVALSPDGRTFAAGGYDGTFTIRETLSRKRCLPVSERNGVVRAIAFSPDGKLVAFTSDTREIVVWDTRTGKEAQTFKGHRAQIHGLEFSPDGRMLASSASDSSVLIWNVPAAPDLTKRLTNAEREQAIAHLASENPVVARRAVVALSHDSEPLPAAFVNRLKPAEAIKDRDFSKWIADLAHRRFADRERARQELEQAGESAVESLQKALTDSTSTEQRRRIERLLDLIEDRIPSGDELWMLRALAVLETRGDTASRTLIEKIAGGKYGMRLTIEAAEILERRKSDWPKPGDAK